jgi:bifunctional UDP-N-acetylglucosamine pyrophosphorylase/glucosamine-1-phosphate N-acetyltransferase
VFRDDRLVKVLQTREGDSCTPGGAGDVGTFVLSVDGLYLMWQQFLAQADRGAHTGETNFLPFIPFLAHSGWDIRHFWVNNANEARGVNSPEDLVFFSSLFRQEKHDEP